MTSPKREIQSRVPQPTVHCSPPQGCDKLLFAYRTLPALRAPFDFGSRWTMEPTDAQGTVVDSLDYRTSSKSPPTT